MFAFFRKTMKSLVTKILIVLLISSFALWGMSDLFRSSDTPVLVKVGNEEITQAHYEQALTQELLFIRLQTGENLSREEARRRAVPVRTLNRLISEGIIDGTLHRTPLSVTDIRLAREIRKNPLFQDASGAFNSTQFQRVLDYIGVSEEDYIKNERKSLERRQFVEGLFPEMALPSVYVKGIMDYAKETRDVAYLVIDASHADSVPEGDETTLMTFYEAEKARFTRPEYRRFSFLMLSRDQLVHPEQITPEELEEAYARSRNLYTIPEKRHVFQIRFDSPEEAERAENALKEGVGFDALLEKYNLSSEDADLGIRASDAFVDQKLAEKAFSLPKGGVSDVIAGTFGPVIIMVKEIIPEKVTSEEEAKALLRQDMAQAKAIETYVKSQSLVEDALVTGATLEEISRQYGLPLIDIPPVSKEGQGQAPGDSARHLPPALLEQVFSANEGDAARRSEFPESNQTFWYRLQERIPETVPPFAEIQEDVYAAWQDEQGQKALAEKTRHLQEQLKKGDSLASLAQENTIPVLEKKGISRPSFSKDFPALQGDKNGIDRLFRTQKGGNIVLSSTDGKKRFLFVITALDVPAFFAQEADTRVVTQQLVRQFPSLLLSSYIRYQQDKLGVRVNQALLQRVLE